MKKLWSLWDHFWFQPVSLLNLGIFRALIAGTMFCLYFSRGFDWKIYYSDQGLVPRSFALDIFPGFYRPYFEWFFWPDAWAGFVHAGLVISLLLFAIGLGGRVMGIIAWVLHMGFMQRNFSIAFGADVIGGIFLLYLMLSNSTARFSFDAWWRQSRGKSVIQTGLLTPIFYRMIQVQLCVIYAFSGFEKLRGASWWDGTALWTVVANPQMVVMDVTFLKAIPFIFPVMTFATLLFEIYFPVLVWFRKTRVAMIILGCLFHLGIGIFLALPGFSAVMVFTYILFLPESLPRNFLLKIKSNRLISRY